MYINCSHNDVISIYCRNVTAILHILDLNRCCSFVGRISGYIQPVSISYLCSFSSTVHEIGHALGFYHEQSRPDRDKYVTIHQQNIRPGYESQFPRYDTTIIDSLGVPYDFSSIMHYSKYAFAKNGTNITISSKEKDMPFGYAPELSPLDINQTNLLYKDQCSKFIIIIMIIN